MSYSLSSDRRMQPSHEAGDDASDLHVKAGMNGDNDNDNNGKHVAIDVALERLVNGEDVDEVDRGSRARRARRREEEERANQQTGAQRQPQSSPRGRRDIESASRDAIPFEPNRPHLAPRANPEFDDDDEPSDRRPFIPNAPFPGVDDGFFDPPSYPRPIGPSIPEVPETDPNHPNTDDLPPKPSNGRWPWTFYDPTWNAAPGAPGSVDVNVYQHRKTLAQGLFDLALLSANANQLRYVVESYKRHPYYYFSLSLIITSIVLQVLVGIGLILNSRYNVKDYRQICIANRINNLTVIGIFLVTFVNVFISAFGVADAPSG